MILPNKDSPIVCVVGARPNLMKVAPILKVFSKLNTGISIKLVHTGQHYDPNLNGKPSEELGLPCPDVNLQVGSGSHAWVTGEIMQRFEPVLLSLKPRCVLVVGDVNSSLACALVAVKLGVPVVHIEAGLRSGDRSMPEEINRLIIDRISDRLYVTERSAWDNLIAEGIKAEQISFTGNVMIDSLKTHLNESPEISSIAARYSIPSELLSAREGFALVTLHRPSNVDDAKNLSKLLYIFGEIAKRLPLIFILHPRTQGKIAQFCLGGLLAAPRLFTLPALGYRDMLAITSKARCVLTDSGGVQEETTALGIPCLTLRENTERPITVDQGTNQLVGTDREMIHAAIDCILCGEGKGGNIPMFWDGHASERIVQDLCQWLQVRESAPQKYQD